MDACRPLREYVWFADTARRCMEITDRDTAMDKTISGIPADFVIREEILKNRAEVKMMYLTWYDEEEIRKMDREEGRMEGVLDVVKNLIALGDTDTSKLACASSLPRETIQACARELGVILS